MPTSNSKTYNPVPTLEQSLERVARLLEELVDLARQREERERARDRAETLSRSPLSGQLHPDAASASLWPDGAGQDPGRSPDHGRATRGPDPSWIPVLHRGCGRPAYYLTRVFQANERADRTAMRVCYPGDRSWREPNLGEFAVCVSCLTTIRPLSSTDLDFGLLYARSARLPRLPPARLSPASFPGATAEEQQDLDAALESLQSLLGGPPGPDSDPDPDPEEDL